ncbi:unnamed protein product [Amoebophrya sp. A120]|nr:unnamed protein product [Amoebophrya sp. A120]|eukprot:GSA120T00001973001.1
MVYLSAMSPEQERLCMSPTRQILNWGDLPEDEDVVPVADDLGSDAEWLSEDEVAPMISNADLLVVNPSGLKMVPATLVFKLPQVYTIWFDAQRKKDYASGISRVCNVATVQEFWRCWNNINFGFAQGSLGVFREGIRPEWEDPENKEGGRWILTTMSRDTLAAVNKKRIDMFTDLVLGVIGGHFSFLEKEDSQDAISGAVLSLAKGRQKVELWNRKANKDNLVKVDYKIRSLLDLENNTDMDVEITYKSHSGSLRRTIKRSHTTSGAATSGRSKLSLMERARTVPTNASPTAEIQGATSKPDVQRSDTAGGTTSAAAEDSDSVAETTTARGVQLTRNNDPSVGAASSPCSSVISTTDGDEQVREPLALKSSSTTTRRVLTKAATVMGTCYANSRVHELPRGSLTLGHASSTSRPTSTDAEEFDREFSYLSSVSSGAALPSVAEEEPQKEGAEVVEKEQRSSASVEQTTPCAPSSARKTTGSAADSCSPDIKDDQASAASNLASRLLFDADTTPGSSLSKCENESPISMASTSARD